MSIRAVRAGIQEAPKGYEPVELWTIYDEIPGFAPGSTVARATIEKHGSITPVVKE